TGSVGIGTVSPTAVLHLKAGTATASTAPLKFTSGSLLTIPEAGSIEFLTDTYYGTITTGAARKTFAFTEDITTTLGSYLKLDQTTPQTTVGTFTFPKVVGTTDITTPLLIGGSAVDSKLTYKSTTGTGTTSAIAHQWLGGTNGGTVIATMLNNGNVGIGTTAPRDALDFATINGSSDAKNILMGVYNGPTGGGGTTLGGGIVWKANYTGYTKRSAGILQIAEDNYFQAGLAFYTNGSADATTDWSERMRINKAGNVGIGQTAPVAKLGITGNASIGATYGALAAPVSGLIIEGNVGIGTTSPGQKLAVLGAAGDTAVVSISTTSGNTCTFSTTTGSFSCASDIRLKNDVVEILGTDALSKLTEINPVTFHYNWQDENDSLVSGFIAQDFEKVFPEMVSTNSTTGYKSLSYAPLVPYLVQAIQELDIKISNLEKGTIASPADTINDYGEYASLFFSDILVKVENGIAYIKNLVVDTLKIGSPDKRTGITFYDEVNGNPYCFSVSNGTTKTLLGECAVITPPEVIVASGDDTISLPEDINTPITTLNGESVVSLDLGATYNELGALAIDEIEGEIAVVISGDVDTSIAGIYTITYSATNSSGGTSSTTRTVRVGDEDIPIIITNTEPQPEADQPLEEIQESTITETTTVEEITEPTPEPEVDQPSGEVSV
ncbi:TPA: hypothetical protein DD445_01220, partial [Candidatus Nomurabacteria bacterium]|nr:hypothetical protein [Candidatus Nomurabacteria bacterium]HBR65903.1 hypothetical protein [Candidatus Nomurabacteria bacterium]